MKFLNSCWHEIANKSLSDFNDSTKSEIAKENDVTPRY